MRRVPHLILGLVVASLAVRAAAEPAPLPAPGPAASPAVAVAPAGVRTIIVIRHAEAEPTQPGGDPTLTADGLARAVELGRVLVDTPLHTVYTTHFQRNRKTVAQLPRHAGDKPTVIDGVPDILRALRGEPWGATALVVGHSNTVPDLLRGLTGQALPDGEPILFDRIWIVTMARDGSASLLRLRYGAQVPVLPPAATAPLKR
jgi:phosphohistidine phosphatase SixA